MVEQEQLQNLIQNVQEWNNWIAKQTGKIDLHGAKLRGAKLRGINLSGANLSRADLAGADLTGANLQGANLQGAKLGRDFGVNQTAVHSRSVNLTDANLSEANLAMASLRGANLQRANLTGANLHRTDLFKTNLREAKIGRANLTRANLNKTSLDKAILIDKNQIGPQIVDVNLAEVNLNVVDWTQVEILGDEQLANQKRQENGKLKDYAIRLEEYSVATRANRQLSVALTEQGLNKEAEHFAYNGQVCYRKYLYFSLIQKSGWGKVSLFFKWLGSLFLWLVAGYGYRFGRAFILYLCVIFSFGAIYWLFTGVAPIPAFVESINVFHGRGISTPAADAVSKSDFLLIVAGVEATIGLMVEIILIAALTQRLFAK